MAFDTEIFLKDSQKEKVLFKTKDDQLKRFSSKILKMDKNNQYGFALTKPLPWGCIKNKKCVPSYEELAEILKSITLEDKLGHLFIIDIEFADVNKKKLYYLMKFIHQFSKRIKK